MNILRLIETEFQGETNPGNYMGPEIDAFGIVTNNSDDVTHTPESEKKRKKRKKEKEDMETVSSDETAPVEESRKDDFLDELMEDPRLREMLTRILSNIKVGNMREDFTSSIDLYVDTLLEASRYPAGSIGPATASEWKELGTFDYKAVQKAIEVESEHTTNKAVAAKIALAHFKEDPEYYTKLSRVEGEEPYVKTS